MSIFSTHSGSIDNLNTARVRPTVVGEQPLENRVQAAMAQYNDELRAALANLNTVTKPVERTTAGECTHVGGTSFIAGCSKEAAALISSLFSQAPAAEKGHGRS